MQARRTPVMIDRGSAGGFTLVELMVVVLIVAILAGIAIPSYRNYVLRGQVVNATNGLSTVSANMERWFQDNRTYIGGPCTATTYGLFTVACSTATPTTATTFLLVATGNTGTSVQGFTYSIDQAGNQASVVTTPAPAAWQTTCATSWETKAGQC